eukprot:6131724-Pleurochrysis_carterae.AAC.1
MDEAVGGKQAPQWALISIVGIKDTHVRNVVVPMPLRRRRLVGIANLLCAYHALKAAWLAREAEVPAAQRKPGGTSRTPFFTDNDGLSPWTSATSHRVAKMMARRAAKTPPTSAASAGGSAALPTCATGWAILGDASRTTIKQRGRWASDVAEVYQRAPLDHQLDASADMANATSADLEALVDGWSQPASF